MAPTMKIVMPEKLPETGLTRVNFKTFINCFVVYFQQNDDFVFFLKGGLYETWKAAESIPLRIETLHADDIPTEAAQGEPRLKKRQKDLATMLSMLGSRVDQYDYDDVVNMSTSLEYIWKVLELVYDIGRKGVHFLELRNIQYKAGEVPAKFFKRLYHHFQDNLYKNGDPVKYKNITLTDDEKLSPSMMNFILFFTIHSIDPRLVNKIKDKWGHLLDDTTCLYDLKDTILKAIPEMVQKIDKKEFEANAMHEFGAFGASRGRGGRFNQAGRGRFSYNQKSTQRGQISRKFCRMCQAAKCPARVYQSHNISECTRWSKNDVEDLRIMMCEMQVDPAEYPSSDSEATQD